MALDAIPNGTQNNIPVYQRFGLDFESVYGQNMTTLQENPINNFFKAKQPAEAYNIGQALTARFNNKPDANVTPSGSTFSTWA
ncbi:hypothetical protein IJ579_08775 [bacterium]|nr:hypothetical protein [bacterium]